MRKSKTHERQVKSKMKLEKEEPITSFWTLGFIRFLWKVLLPIVVMSIAACLGYKGYNETRVNTPFSSEKLVSVSGLDKLDYYWGSYRPGVYFGTKTREPYSLVTGMMWYFPATLQADGRGLRHWCTQDDKLQKYGWIKHDGKNFGIQEIVDNDVLIKTSFVKNIHGLNGGDWTARISVTPITPNPRNKKMSLLYYTAIEDKTNGNVHPVVDPISNTLSGVEGETKELGYFKLHYNVLKGNVEDQSYLVTTAPSLSFLKETVFNNLRVVAGKGKSKEKIVLLGEELRHRNGQILMPNFIVTQVTAELPLELEVRFERSSMVGQKEKLTGKVYDTALRNYEDKFDEKFEKTFKLKQKGYTEDEINFAKLAFSNMIGSIGYFYGSAQVQSVYTELPVPYWKAPLFTSVPSRSFFPRGFLWDEGFHGLLLSSWNLDIEMDIISHWFDLMNVEGWIPREMILGDEALAKVPEEFVTQVNTNANPPTFFITLQYILDHKRNELLPKHHALLDKLYPRLQTWFEWFNNTQKGEIPSTYRWRGRNEVTNKELNPKTLTSGLDDYPRASHPNKNERHIDLRCWMALASKVMGTLANILGKCCASKYENTFEHLANNQLMNELHWSPKTSTYSDYGLHTDKVMLQKPAQASRQMKVPQDKIRVVLEEPEYKFVDSSFGYVSLFPFMLRLVDPSSFQLKKILQDLENPQFLWTNYGLRSLAKSSPIYMKRNTEHDPPYWRGAIWMNMNYLTVAALHHYSKIDGPFRVEAAEIYLKLRKNLIKNVIDQYKKTGYLWENYGDTIGEGKGSHPFTGWTSLTVLLMAEMY